MSIIQGHEMCVRACMRACVRVRACVRACACVCVRVRACVRACVRDKMSVSLYLCKCSGLLRDGAPQIIYHSIITVVLV